MTKEQSAKIRPEARKLVIKSYLIDLVHQLYRDMWLKLEIVIIIIQWLLVIIGIGAQIYGVTTLPINLVIVVGTWIFGALAVIGSIICNKAMKKAKETKQMLYRLIDSMPNLIVINDKEIGCEEDENEE